MQKFSKASILAQNQNMGKSLRGAIGNTLNYLPHDLYGHMSVSGRNSNFGRYGRESIYRPIWPILLKEPREKCIPSPQLRGFVKTRHIYRYKIKTKWAIIF